MDGTIIGGIVAFSVLFVVLLDLRYKRTARRHLAGRPRRSSAEFGREFYPGQASIAAEMRDILAEHLPVDLSQVEPSDQPVRDLRMDDLDSLATVDFVVALEGHFGIKIENADAEQMRTVDDVIRYVIKKLDEKRTGVVPREQS